MAENNDPHQVGRGALPKKCDAKEEESPYKACYWYHPRTQKIGAGPVKHRPGEQFMDQDMIESGLYLVAITPHALELWRALSEEQKRELPIGSIKKAFYCPGKGCLKNDCGQSPCSPHYIGALGKFLDQNGINVCIRPVHWEALNKLYHGMLLGPVNLAHIGGGPSVVLIKSAMCESLPSDSIFLVDYTNNRGVDGVSDVETVIKDGDAVTTCRIALN